MQWCGSILLPHNYIVYNDVFLRKFNNCNFARYKYELPDDGHRPKHVGAI